VRGIGPFAPELPSPGSLQPQGRGVQRRRRAMWQTDTEALGFIAAVGGMLVVALLLTGTG
jgi:hypothetical protein